MYPVWGNLFRYHSESHSPIHQVQYWLVQMKCVVCRKTSRYRCPKCNAIYCSSDHYRSHNLFCTEDFYKEQVESNLKGMKSTPQQARKMRETLEQEPPELPSAVTERYEQILQSLENNEEVKLSYGEEVRFAEFVKNWAVQQGQVQFWETEQGMSVYHVTDLQPDEVQESEIVFYRRQLKAMIDSLPNIRDLCGNPNSQVIYGIYHLVYAGCVLFRYYDGQVVPNKEQFCSLLNKICPIAGGNSVSSVAQAHYVCHLPQLPDLKPWLRLAKQDCMTIFKNKYLVLQMLFRLVGVLGSKKAQKKVDFYCSYAREANMQSINCEIQDSFLRQELQDQGRGAVREYQQLFSVK